MKVELHITKEQTTLKLPCGCVCDYDTHELIKLCKQHKESDDE